jgi:hypothetical protein
MRPLPFAASDFSCAIAEKSAVNDAGVMLTLVFELDGVVVAPDPVELFDELPQALAARRTLTVTAKSAVRFETRITASFRFELGSGLIPIRPRNMPGEIEALDPYRTRCAAYGHAERRRVPKKWSISRSCAPGTGGAPRES